MIFVGLVVAIPPRYPQFIDIIIFFFLSILGIHLTDEYKENVNRFKKVPAIVTANNFKLSESIAIFRYLAASNPIADNWYPKDLEERARIDEYFAWQHLNTRMTCMYFFILKYLKPRTTGKEIGDDEIVRSSQKQMEDVLNKIENLWLDDKPNTFIGGLNELSFADLLAACELEQPSKPIPSTKHCITF